MKIKRLMKIHYNYHLFIYYNTLAGSSVASHNRFPLVNRPIIIAIAYITLISKRRRYFVPGETRHRKKVETADIVSTWPDNEKCNVFV